MEINCEFSVGASRSLNANHYQCKIMKANITEKDHEITELKGIHKSGKTHNDVMCVWFTTTTELDYFPRGLEKHFPNLIRLHISGSGIKEISKDDLKGLERLVDLCVEDCQLKSIPDDLLTEMPNLRKVSFRENKIEFTSSKFLKPLLGRENVKVDLYGTKDMSAWCWPGYGRSLESLEELMKVIDETCLKNSVDFNPKVKEIWASGKFSDLTIIAGEKKFKVHKNILGMQSKVFAQIFEEPNEATELKISDFSSNSVEALLKFIYTNEATEGGNAKENYEIAIKFKVKAMKLFYKKLIADQINDENVWDTFLFAHQLSSQQLKEKAFQRIITKIPEEVPEKLIENPEKLKKLIDHRKAYDEILADK